MRELIRKILREENDKLQQNHPMINAIKHVVGNEYEGYFYQPWDEYYQDFIVRFHITKITMWNTKGYEQRDSFLRSIYHPKSDSTFEGTISVKIDTLLVGDKRNDEWEKMYGEDDITETAWDDFREYISDTVAKWLPGVNLDVDIDF